MSALLSFASCSLFQSNSVSDPVAWKSILTPVDVAVSSVGMTRSKLVTRLETETSDKSFSLPKEARPTLWVYEWRGLDQFYDGSVKCQITFSKTGIVETVRVSTLKVKPLPFIGNIRSVWPQQASRSRPNTLEREWTLDQGNASIWIDISRLKELYTANSYRTLVSGYPGGGMELEIALSKLNNGPYIYFQCWESAAYVSSPVKTLNPKTGVYDNSIQLKNVTSNSLTNFSVIAVTASSKPQVAREGYVKMKFEQTRVSVPSPRQIPATKRDEALLDAKAVALAIQLYADENANRLPSASNARELLDPFVKNSKSLQDFTWTFTGSSLVDISSRDKVVLGYVYKPGGKALIYASFAVRWQSGPYQK